MSKKKFIRGEIYPGEFRLERRVRESDGQEVQIWCGTHQWADRENANKRVYPRGLWEKLFTNEVFSQRLETRQLSGQLSHPEGEGIVNPRFISHVTTWLEMRPDGEVYGESEILPTPDGNILSTLLECEVMLGISSRGWGDSYMEGEVEVLEEEGYELGGFDAVVEPSVDVAFPKLQKVNPQAIKDLASRVYDKVGTYERDETVRPYLREELLRWEGLFKRSARLTEALKTESRGSRSIIEEIDRVLTPVGVGRRVERDTQEARARDLIAEKGELTFGQMVDLIREKMSDITSTDDAAQLLARIGVAEEKTRIPEGNEPDNNRSKQRKPDKGGKQEEGKMDNTQELAKLTATVSELRASLQVVADRKDEEIGALKRTIQRLNGERTSLDGRVKASEQLIEALRKRADQSQRRATAGEDALGEALGQGKSLRRQAKVASSRLGAAEKVIESSLTTIKSERSDRLKSAVIRLSQRFTDTKKAKALLETARSVKEAYKMARDLRNFGGTSNGNGNADDLSQLHSRVRRPSGPRRKRERAPRFSSDRQEQAMFEDSLRLTGAVVKHLASRGKAKLPKKE